MCDECGCGDHDHHEHREAGQRRLDVGRKVLAHNDELAAQNRQWLQQRSVVALNMMSSPGTGKTLLLEKTLGALAGSIGCAVITGDLRTDNDAKRLKGLGAEVIQIETGSACHLDAHQVGHAMRDVVKDGTQLLFIENVGNLVCPAAFDLGEHLRIALLSTTEGEDKPSKYPSLFAQAPVIVLTKTDLVPHLDWDRNACMSHIRKLSPTGRVFELSARTGQGMPEWLAWLTGLAGENSAAHSTL